MIRNGPLDRERDAELKEHQQWLWARMCDVAPASPRQRLRLLRLPRWQQPPSFTGHTQLDPDYTIQIAADLDWHGQRHSCVRRFCQLTGVKATNKTVLETILAHELGHEIVCPKNHHHAYEMRLAVASVLKRLGRYTPDLSQYIANLVADILVNVVNGGLWRSLANGTYTTGLLLTWYDQGASPYYPSTLAGRLRGLLATIGGSRKFTPLFEVFVRSQAGFLPHAETGYRYLLAPYVRHQSPPPRRGFSQEPEAEGGNRPRDPGPTIEDAADRIAELIQDREVITSEEAWPTLAREIC